MDKIGSKLAFSCAGFVLAIATMAVAQSYDPDVGSGNIAYLVQPDGSTSRLGGKTGRVNDVGHKMIMSHAQELPPGSVLYRSGNKLHALKNQMVEGKMAHEWEQTWTQ
jgi:hypothetical protein